MVVLECGVLSVEMIFVLVTGSVIRMVNVINASPPAKHGLLLTVIVQVSFRLSVRL